MSVKTLICLHTAPVVGVSDVFLLPEDKSVSLVESNAASVQKLHDDESAKFDFFMKGMKGATITIIGSIEDGRVSSCESLLLVDFDSVFHDVVMKDEAST